MRTTVNQLPDPAAIKNYIHASKYARYLPELQRRELYDETVDRVELMHLKKFPELRQEINEAFALVRDQRVLPSMRSMQFGGRAVEVNHARQYNCASTLVDRPRVFAEAMFLLLSGCGVGYSVQYEHVEQLPQLAYVDNTKVVHHVIQDTVEGWSDAVDALINAYIGGYLVEFSYHLVRNAGAPLQTSGGRAPGHRKLRKSLERIRAVLHGAQGRQLRPIECHRIMCHAADAVLSGGIRRSAMIALFSYEDSEMMNCKADPDWFEREPWLANSNNSVVFVHGEVQERQFRRVFQFTRKFGEPGFAFLNNSGHVYNPCQPEWATVLTPEGIRTFKDIDAGSTIWSGKQWTKVTKKWCTGVKPVFGYHTRAGVFYGTDTHRIIQNGARCEVKDAETIDIAYGGAEGGAFDVQAIMDGLVLGDGTVHHASNDAVWLCIGKDDDDYHASEVAPLIGRHREAANPYAWEIITNIKSWELPCTYNRKVPDRYKFGDEQTVRSFLRGLYSANGSIVSDRVTLKVASKQVIIAVQQMLSSLGIVSYYTTNHPTEVEFENGSYVCKESYDLNITTGRRRFADLIGFVQKHKQERLAAIVSRGGTKPRKTSYEIAEVEPLGAQPVFDITVEADEHTYWTGGLLVSNCFEVGMDPTLVNDDGSQQTGWSMCVAGDTRLLTRTGLVTIGRAVGQPIEIWNGSAWTTVTPFETGTNRDLYRVSFGDGSFLDCTDNHKFLVKDRFMSDFKEVETKDLMAVSKYAIHIPRSHVSGCSGVAVQEAYTYGFLLGDGTMAWSSPEVGGRRYSYARAAVFGDKLTCPVVGLRYPLGRTENGVPCAVVHMNTLDIELARRFKHTDNLPAEVFGWDESSILALVGGWADADGSEANNGIRIYGAEGLIRDLQLLLTKVGVNASVNFMQDEGVATNVGIRNYAMWYAQIPDARKIPTHRLVTANGVAPHYKGKFQVVRSVEKLPGKHTTYCLEEPDTHTCLFNNVITKQCNLTEINASKLRSLNDFREAAGAAALIGTLQAAYTSFPYLGEVTEKIVQRDALIGVGMTGMQDSPEIALNPEYQRECADLVVQVNAEYASKLGIRRAARCTVIKPAGTTSLALGSVGSGIHPHHAERYIRRVTADSLEFVFQAFKAKNPHMCVKKPDGKWVIEFAVQAPEGARLKEDFTAVEFMEMVRSTQQNWIVPGTTRESRSPGLRHNVSNTIQVRAGEWSEVADFLWNHRTEFTGVSMLPDTGDTVYPYAPFEAVKTEAQQRRWDDIVNSYQPLDYSSMLEGEDGTALMGEASCANGACER